MMQKEVLASQDNFSKGRLDSLIDYLASKLDIDCIYFGHESLPFIGHCNLYIALDARDELEKYAMGKLPQEFKGYDPCFAKHIWDIDGRTLNGLEVNSVLLTPEEIENTAKRNSIKFNLDHSRIAYEIITIRGPCNCYKNSHN